MATVLTILQDAALGVKIPPPQAVVKSSLPLHKELLAHLHHVGWLLRNRYEWPQLEKEWPVTLVSNQESYPLPGDFNRFINRTMWARARRWEVVGPVSPQEWQYLKRGVINDLGPRQRFRVKGTESNKFFVSPKPDTVENGNVIGFEYLSDNWVLPKLWTAATAVTTGEYCSWEGNVYKAIATGVTDSWPPVHTTGSVGDNTTAWLYVGEAYNRVLADTDVPQFDDRLMSLGVEWVFLKNNGFSYQERQQEWEREVLRHLTKLTGSRTLSYTGKSGDGLLSYDNIPDSGYGK